MASRGWTVFFRASYAVVRLLDPILRAGWRGRVPWFRRFVAVRVPGRTTGRPRSTLVTLLTVGERRYVGHPNGPAAWTRNLLAAGECGLEQRDRSVVQLRAVVVSDGPEREGVIRATWSQQPFPANVAYRLAAGHIRAVGVYFRLAGSV